MAERKQSSKTEKSDLPSWCFGDLTAEERAGLAVQADLWTTRALRMAPIELSKVTGPINTLYRAAGLKEPTIVIAPSPMAAGVGAAFTAGLLYLKANHGSCPDPSPQYPAQHAVRRTACYAVMNSQEMRRNPDKQMVDESVAHTVNSLGGDIFADAAYESFFYVSCEDSRHHAHPNRRRRQILKALRAIPDYSIAKIPTDMVNIAAAVAGFDVEHPGLRAEVITTGIQVGMHEPSTAEDYQRQEYDARMCSAYKAVLNCTRQACGDVSVLASLRNGVPPDTNWIIELAQRISPEHWKFLAYCVDDVSDSNFLKKDMLSDVFSDAAFAISLRDVMHLKTKKRHHGDAWEQLICESNISYMHRDFCILSDFPVRLRVDEKNRPHCDSGPSFQWKDGWALYHIHGKAVPQKMVSRARCRTFMPKHTDEER
jgi:hypothetical protein